MDAVPVPGDPFHYSSVNQILVRYMSLAFCCTFLYCVFLCLWQSFDNHHRYNSWKDNKWKLTFLLWSTDTKVKERAWRCSLRGKTDHKKDNFFRHNWVQKRGKKFQLFWSVIHSSLLETQRSFNRENTMPLFWSFIYHFSQTFALSS